jgi:hypothetical protein
MATVNVVKGSVEEQALKQKYGDQVQFNYGQNQFVGNDRADTANQYDKYLANQGVKPVNTNVDLNSLQGVNVANGRLADASGNNIYDEASQIGNMQNQARSMADSYLANQKATLGQALQNQIAELSKAYTDAIAEGKISVRDAQDNFTSQKAALEKQAYLDSQKTAL